MREANSGQALLVDLYELTMAAAYFEHRVDCRQRQAGDHGGGLRARGPLSTEVGEGFCSRAAVRL